MSEPSIVTAGQAPGMGGADKKAGAQADNTFQNKDTKQLVVLVRYKPKPPAAGPSPGDMTAAAGLIKGATGAIESGVSAVEGAMSQIPGLKMFIKEDKKDSKSEKDYEYKYTGWDTQFAKIGPNLQQVNQDNKTDTFEFASTDAAGRKTDGQSLFTKVKSGVSGWQGHHVWVHLIGIGQGGNVINECTAKLAGDGAFRSENWCVKSIIYVGASLYKNEHVLSKDVFKGEGQAFYFGNPFDLTQRGVDFFEPNDKLLKMIKDSNSNTLSLAVGKVKIRVIKILALLLSGLEISTTPSPGPNKFDLIKSEIEGMISDAIDLLQSISRDTASFVKLPDLPDFGKMMDGAGDIPGQCVQELKDFIGALTKKVGDDLGKGTFSLNPESLAGLLNCLCPLFDHITAALSLFKFQSKTGAGLAQQIIDSAGITKLYAPDESNDDDDLSKSDTYGIANPGQPPSLAEAAKRGLAITYVSRAKDIIAETAGDGSDIKSFTDEKKIALAEAIFLMARPMMVSKEQVYELLLGYADGLVHFDKLSKDISSNTAMGIPAEKLKTLGIDYPPALKNSINNNDQELSRIKGYFDKNNFGLQEDSQYFIINSRNVVLKNMPDAVAYCIDQQTLFLDYKKSAGYDNEFPDTGKYNYKLVTAKDQGKVMAANPLPAKSK